MLLLMVCIFLILLLSVGFLYVFVISFLSPSRILIFFLELEVAKIDDLFNHEQVTRFIKSAIMAKQYGFEDTIADVVAQACIQICPKNPKAFDVDNVRTIKIEGGGVSDLSVVKGLVLQRNSEGTIKKVENAKVVVFGGGIDFGKTESKDTFLITEAEQLEGFQKEQEDHMEKIIKSIADTGVKAIVCNGSVGPLALHFMEVYKLMVIKVGSKFDISRICKAVGASPTVRMGAPTEEELGYCDSISIEEIGSTKVCIFKQVNEKSKISTIIIRGATENIINDIERSIEDGINTYKAMTKDPRFVAGGGSFEIALSLKLKKEGDSISGQDQYSFKKFAEALEVVPRTLAENSGHNSTLSISNLYAAHSTDGNNACIDVDTGDLVNALDQGIFDHLAGKKLAITLATDAALNVLKIDQILMVKRAEGPKVPPPRPMDAD